MKDWRSQRTSVKQQIGGVAKDLFHVRALIAPLFLMKK